MRSLYLCVLHKIYIARANRAVMYLLVALVACIWPHLSLEYHLFNIDGPPKAVRIIPELLYAKVLRSLCEVDAILDLAQSYVYWYSYTLLGPSSQGLEIIVSNWIIPSAFSISPQLILLWEVRSVEYFFPRIINRALFITSPTHGWYASMAKKCLSKRVKRWSVSAVKFQYNTHLHSHDSIPFSMNSCVIACQFRKVHVKIERLPQ